MTSDIKYQIKSAQHFDFLVYFT